MPFPFNPNVACPRISHPQMLSAGGLGELGRTPKINKNVSRDHGPHCYTALLAFGGLKRGYVHGSSDKNGGHPAYKPVKPDDLAATMYHVLGIQPDTEVRDVVNRPVPISYGKVIQKVIA